MKWQYTIPNTLAEEFRNAIQEDDYAEVCNKFVEVCSWIQAHVPDAEYDMESLLDESELWDIYDEDFEDEMNYCLDELFDICDAYRIWIPV